MYPSEKSSRSLSSGEHQSLCICSDTQSVWSGVDGVDGVDGGNAVYLNKTHILLYGTKNSLKQQKILPS